jgi:adenylosuccinate synthase
MAAVVIVGAQWGDEGKGKVVDIFTAEADLVVRYAGGPNAGHTLVVEGEKVIVRLIPSGILHPGTQCVLAQGMVIDPATLLTEIDELVTRGKLPRGVDKSRLAVSDRAHAILPYHVLVDTLREQGARAIGTTKRGVGPCYEDKVGRRGVPLGALRDLGRARELISAALESWAPTVTALGGKLPSIDDVMQGIEPLARRIVPLLTDTATLVEGAVRAKKKVLLEGAQGTLLDIDHGTYPFVTSSSATAGGACTGAGVGPTRIDKVVGLAKAYSTRVGGGPFPTELSDDTGARLREKGAEFGSVTGRPRRTGWLDVSALSYAVRVNGLDALALTKLDVLTGLSELKVCVAHRGRDGTVAPFAIDQDPACEPVYETLPGWSESLVEARSMSDLPRSARDYVDFIEQRAACPIELVSVGPGRDETIIRRPPFEPTGHSRPPV